MPLLERGNGCMTNRKKSALNVGEKSLEDIELANGVEKCGTTTFSKRLMILKQEKGVTTTQIHQATGISRSTINKFLTSDNLPNSFTLILLCQYFNASADWLLGLSNFRRLKK